MRLIYLQILLLTIGTAYSQNNCDKYSDDYVPKNLTDALEYLNCTWSDKDKEEFKSNNENDAVAEIHMGTGRGIRNNWGLWKGKNSLSRYFSSKGIFHPDDMSSIILTSFHRHLNNKAIDLDGQVKYYKDYWRQANEQYERENKLLTGEKKKEFGGYHIGDTVKIAFLLYTNQNPVRVYAVQGHPDLNEIPNCYVTGIVKGKRIRKGTDYTLKILVTDICNYQTVYWSSIHEKYGDFRVGQEYDFFSIKSFKITRQ